MAVEKTHSLVLEGQYAFVPTEIQNGLDITGSMTLEFWITNGIWTEYSNYGWWLNKGSYGVYERGGILGIPAVIGLHLSDGVNSQDIDLTGLSTTESYFTHVAIVVDFNEGKMFCYVNGFLRQTTNLTISSIATSPLTPLTIGTDSNHIHLPSTVLGYVRVWNTALDANTIVERMRHGSPPTDNLVGYWKFDNNFADASGKGNDLTAIGSPSFSTDVPFQYYGVTSRLQAIAGGDGYVTSHEASGGLTWAAIRAETAGNTVDNTDDEMTVGVTKRFSGGFNFYYPTLHRGFLPFPTEDLDDSISINDAYLYLVGSGQQVGVIQSSQATPTGLTTDDYDTAGALDAPNEGASRVALAVNGSWVQLNTTGRGWISKNDSTKFALREAGHDIDGANPGSSSTSYTASVNTANHTSVYNRPHLDVVYEPQGESEGGDPNGGSGESGSPAASVLGIYLE
jgi:hypothetical protein